MRPEDYLTFAQQLTQNHQPSSLRSAISRAYYAAYHVVGRVQTEVGGSRKGSRSHTVICERFSVYGTTKEIVALGGMLENLKYERHKADYDFQYKKAEDAAFVIGIVEEAELLITRVKAYKENHLEEEMRKSIAKCTEHYRY